MKKGFFLAKKGSFEDQEEQNNNLLILLYVATSNVSYIKDHKVVIIKDLATKFGMKTTSTINTIKKIFKKTRYCPAP